MSKLVIIVYLNRQLKKCSGRLLTPETESDIVYQSDDPALSEILKRIVHEADIAGKRSFAY